MVGRKYHIGEVRVLKIVYEDLSGPDRKSALQSYRRGCEIAGIELVSLRKETFGDPVDPSDIDWESSGVKTP